MNSPDDTDGIDEILIAAQLGLFEVVIDYSRRPAELATSLRGMDHAAALQSRGPDDVEPPSVVSISWTLRH